MGQYYYIPDPGEPQRNMYPSPVPDRLAQLRQNQMQQPIMQGPQIGQQGQPMQPQQLPANPMAGSAQNGMIWVNGGKAEADSYLVAPNSAVALWDANNPVVYLRKADSTGKPSTVVYDLVERTDNPPTQPAPQIDLSRYVTIDQLEEILAERLKRPSKPTKPKEDADNG